MENQKGIGESFLSNIFFQLDTDISSILIPVNYYDIPNFEFISFKYIQRKIKRYLEYPCCPCSSSLQLDMIISTTYR